MQYRERVGGDFHDITVEILCHSLELCAVENVLWGEAARRLGNRKHAVEHEGGLRWAQEVAGAILVRDEELGRVSPR